MRLFIFFILILFTIPFSFSQKIKKINYQTLIFGDGGQIKMLYDRRQRPQSVYLNRKVHIVFNAGADNEAKGKSKTKPMIITYNPVTREFSDVVTLGPAKSDHHFCPVIWADTNEKLHILYGCHKTPGTHLISKKEIPIT